MSKSLYTIILFTLFCTSANSQIILTEIMYNPPEAGTDSLEYVEIYNSSDQMIDLESYTFSEGIEHIFTNQTIGPNAYLVLCKNLNALNTAFDNPAINAMEWTDGALQNGGELLELKDADGNVEFSVQYDDSGDWPNEQDGTDGAGASIELCDLMSNVSDAFNWSSSTTGTGNLVDGKEVLGSPGAANNVECRDPSGPMYSVQEILDIRMNDASGVSNFINQFVELQGIVHGTNTNDGGLQFAINDGDNNGIWVYSANENFNYTPVEGNDLIVLGRITQFNGLTRIVPDSVEVLDASLPLVDADLVTVIEEVHEGALIKIENVSMIDPLEWLGDGSSFNINVTDGSNNYVVRILADTDLSNQGAPINLKSITGLGGQFDSSAPHDEGYQLLPRYMNDIESDGFMAGGPNYQDVNIVDIIDEEPNGVASSDGDLVSVSGITYGINYRENGLQFTIIDDQNNGIGIFNDTEDWGYDFTEGDEVQVWGKVGQFFGLTQITLDSIELISQGNTLINPRPVTSLGEDTESSYVIFQGLSYVDPSDWMDDGNSFNIDVTDGVNTITLRIDDNSLFAGLSVPPDPTSFITGIGGQFDTSTPLDSGYQLFPLVFEPYLSNDNLLIDESLTIAPNPAWDYLILNSELSYDQFEIYNLRGELLINTKDSRIDVSQLIEGNYWLVGKKDNKIIRSQFSVNR